MNGDWGIWVHRPEALLVAGMTLASVDCELRVLGLLGLKELKPGSSAKLLRNCDTKEKGRSERD